MTAGQGIVALPTLEDIVAESAVEGIVAIPTVEDIVAQSAVEGVAVFVAVEVVRLVAAVQFVVAFGLLAVKRWAWILALVGVALTVIEGVIGMLTGGPFAFMCGTLGLIVPVIILIYLLRPSVRSAFGVGAT